MAALPSSGAISFNDVNLQLTRTATASLSLNDSAVRSLFGQLTGAVDMNTGHGKSAVVPGAIAITLTADVYDYNIKTAVGASYVSGSTHVTLTINSGVVVGSSSLATYALYTGQGWSAGDTITIINNGYIAGRGGDGGIGGFSGHSGHSGTPGTGTAGGPAVAMGWPITLDNTNGYIYSGGGGGGGGFGGNPSGGGGGGGGAGRVAGGGGSAPMGSTGQNGGLTLGGAGGVNFEAGGAGGNKGASGHYAPIAGTAGGGHGLAINRQLNTINGQTGGWSWPGNTRVYGGIS